MPVEQALGSLLAQILGDDRSQLLSAGGAPGDVATVAQPEPVKFPSSPEFQESQELGFGNQVSLGIANALQAFASAMNSNIPSRDFRAEEIRRRQGRADRKNKSNEFDFAVENRRAEGEAGREFTARENQLSREASADSQAKSIEAQQSRFDEELAARTDENVKNRLSADHRAALNRKQEKEMLVLREGFQGNASLQAGYENDLNIARPMYADLARLSGEIASGKEKGTHEEIKTKWLNAFDLATAGMDPTNKRLLRQQGELLFEQFIGPETQARKDKAQTGKTTATEDFALGLEGLPSQLGVFGTALGSQAKVLAGRGGDALDDIMEMLSGLTSGLPPTPVGAGGAFTQENIGAAVGPDLLQRAQELAQRTGVSLADALAQLKQASGGLGGTALIP